MEFIENLNEKEYEEFVSSSPKSHFMQSYYWGNVSKYKNFTPHYVGLKQNNKIKAAALLLEKKLLKGYTYFYSPRGFVIDFKDKALLETFTTEVKKYAKKNKAVFIKIDPDIKRHNLDPEGNIQEGTDNYEIVESLKSLGYKHLGYNIEFTNEQPRFTFRLGLDKPMEDVYAGMHATTRKILNKENKLGFEIYKGTEKDIKDFYFTMEETAKRENLGCNPIEYYLNFYRELHNRRMSDLYVLKLNVENLREKYQEKIKEIDLKKAELNNNKNVNPKKQENRLKELDIELEKVKKDIEEIKDIKEKEIVLSSIITAKYADKVWTVHGGNATALRNLNANYYLYYQIIKDAHTAKFRLIDFFGCSGEANPDKTSSIYGLHNFKKRLGGEYTEFIGEFDLVTNKFMYMVFKTLVPIRRKLVKRKMKK